MDLSALTLLPSEAACETVVAWYSIHIILYNVFVAVISAEKLHLK